MLFISQGLGKFNVTLKIKNIGGVGLRCQLISGTAIIRYLSWNTDFEFFKVLSDVVFLNWSYFVFNSSGWSHFLLFTQTINYKTNKNNFNLPGTRSIKKISSLLRTMGKSFKITSIRTTNSWSFKISNKWKSYERSWNMDRLAIFI